MSMHSPATAGPSHQYRGKPGSFPASAMAMLSVAILVAAAVGGCSDQTPVAKVESAAELPVTAGYEDAIIAHTMKPIIRPAGTAPAVWGPGDLYNFLVTGEETNNAFFQFEAVVPVNGGPPPHSHSREDESFYIVSGELEILIGESTYSAKAGDFVFIPRGTVHRFQNVGSGTAVQLVTFVPAGMEHFFQEVFPPVTDRSATPPPVTDELIQKTVEAAPRYGLVLPPPPTGSEQ